MSEAEFARDLHEALAKVQQGVEIVVEQVHRPVAVLRAQPRSGRSVLEILREAESRGSAATPDDDFSRDIEEIVAGHTKRWDPPSWD